MDAFKLLDLLGPEKVDPEDVKLLKEKVFGYSTFWVTGQEPFGDLGAGVLLLGNLRGKREEVFAKLQRQLREVTGSKYNLFMVEEPNSEELDPRGGPRVSFVLLRKEVSEPKSTTLWQFVIAFILFFITAGSCLELGIASQVQTLAQVHTLYFFLLLIISICSAAFETTTRGGQIFYESRCCGTTRFEYVGSICGVCNASNLWSSWSAAFPCGAFA
jgi:hypothetical protein